MPVCTIRASDLAAVCGRHPYRDHSEEIKRIQAHLTGGLQKEREVRAQQQLSAHTASQVLEAAEQLQIQEGIVVKQSQKCVENATKVHEAATEQQQVALTVATQAKREHADAVQTLSFSATPEAVNRVEESAQCMVRAQNVASIAQKTANTTAQEVRYANERHMKVIAREMPKVNKRVIEAVETRSVLQAKTQKADPVLSNLSIQSSVRQHQRMAEGTVKEASILTRAGTHFPDLSGAKEPTTNKRLCLGVIDGVTVQLVGKCDALSGESVIEIKNRKSRLFGKVADYERIQLMAYLYLYDQASGYIIESYGNELRRYGVARDDNEWKTLIDETLASVALALNS